jgi:hypothetical protein
MSVSVTPPGGYQEPLPVTLGPNWQPNDVRLVFVSGSGSDAGSDITLNMAMNSDPPTGYTSAYSLDAGKETHGFYYRRLTPSDVDTSISWIKPATWRHFMFALLTVRGVSPTANPTAGTLKLTQTAGDTSLSSASVVVPGAGTAVLFAGSASIPSGGSPWPSWAISLGVPTGWTGLVATDKSGATYYPYGTDPSLVVVGKSYASAGSTGAVAFPSAQGGAAFAGLYAFLTPAADVSVTLVAA